MITFVLNVSARSNRSQKYSVLKLQPISRSASCNRVWLGIMVVIKISDTARKASAL